MFKINSIFDIFSIVSFFLSTWLTIHKLFIKGKPQLKLDTKFANFLNIGDDDTKYLAFSIINSGSGELHLTDCGFFITGKGKTKLVLFPTAYITTPIGKGFPYTIEERKKFVISYPVDTFMQIRKKDKIKQFFVSDETGKVWKFNIVKFRKKVLEIQ